MFKADLHVHLHGCLSAHELWEIGKNKYKKLRKRLEWYELQYEVSCGIRPNSIQYWESEDGLERLKKDYEYLESKPFSHFQARFNLIIALCPISPYEFSIQEFVIQKIAAQNLDYFEARAVIPDHFSMVEAVTYLNGFSRCVNRLNRELKMQTRVVFSLSQDTEIALRHFNWIQSFRSNELALGELIVGIDFAGFEEYSPPNSKISLFQAIRSKQFLNRPIQMTYHAGETFETMSLMSSILRVKQALDLGVHRIGHATSLGIDPKTLADSIGKENSRSFEQMLQTLANDKNLLGNCQTDHLSRRLADIKTQTSETKGFVKFQYSPILLEVIRDLQISVAKIIREKKIVVEVCPTSSMRIGGIKNADEHPLKFFSSQDLRLVLGSDDPGVFASSWDSESKKINELGGDLRAMSREARSLVALN